MLLPDERAKGLATTAPYYGSSERRPQRKSGKRKNPFKNSSWKDDEMPSEGFKMPTVTVDDWDGEAPKGPARGKVRQPNPFDEMVVEAFDNKQAKFVKVPHIGVNDRTEELATVSKLIRAAAQFAGYGADIRIFTPEGQKLEGLYVSIREARKRAPKLPNE